MTTCWSLWNKVTSFNHILWSCENLVLFYLNFNFQEEYQERKGLLFFCDFLTINLYSDSFTDYIRHIVFIDSHDCCNHPEWAMYTGLHVRWLSSIFKSYVIYQQKPDNAWLNSKTYFGILVCDFRPFGWKPEGPDSESNTHYAEFCPAILFHSCWVTGVGGIYFLCVMTSRYDVTLWCHA